MDNENTDCIFCKIVKGEIPSTKIYDSDNFIGILDIHPKAEGHSLIISRQHFSNILDMPSTLGGELVEAVKDIGFKIIKDRASSLSSMDNENSRNAVEAVNNIGGFNVIVNNGEAAGQVVHHFHLHVIPRRSGDGLKGLA